MSSTQPTQSPITETLDAVLAILAEADARLTALHAQLAGGAR
jgi:hypothetical protein